jgi:hypothetical protein
MGVVPIVAWRPRPPKQAPRHLPVSSAGRALGAYVGRVRFTPIHPERLPPELRAAIGCVVEVGFAGVAQSGDPFAGQSLFLEWCRDQVFDGFLIPEQDLEFFDH